MSAQLGSVCCENQQSHSVDFTEAAARATPRRPPQSTLIQVALRRLRWRLFREHLLSKAKPARSVVGLKEPSEFAVAIRRLQGVRRGIVGIP